MELLRRGGDRLRVLSVFVAMGLPGHAALAQMVSLEWVTGEGALRREFQGQDEGGCLVKSETEVLVERDGSWVRDYARARRYVWVWEYSWGPNTVPISDRRGTSESNDVPSRVIQKSKGLQRLADIPPRVIPLSEYLDEVAQREIQKSEGRQRLDGVLLARRGIGSSTGGSTRRIMKRRPGPGRAIGGGSAFDVQLVVGPRVEEPVVEVEKPKTVIERASELVLAGQAQEAAELLAEHLADSPDDAHALRLEGVALLKAGKLPEAVSRILRAYEIRPTLCMEPVSRALFEANGMTVRRLRQKLMVRAARGGKEYWFGVVVLMQADGDYARAEKMLEKAVEAQLDVVLGAEMGAALEQQAAAGRQTEKD